MWQQVRISDPDIIFTRKAKAEGYSNGAPCGTLIRVRLQNLPANVRLSYNKLARLLATLDDYSKCKL
jgi:hypothetical protein